MVQTRKVFVFLKWPTKKEVWRSKDFLNRGFRLNNRPLKFDLALVVRSPRRNLKVSKIFTKISFFIFLTVLKSKIAFAWTRREIPQAD